MRENPNTHPSTIQAELKSFLKTMHQIIDKLQCSSKLVQVRFDHFASAGV
ncbi:hypothetical protein OAN61_00275 [bacterium]|nr:hypothetical protein [bacterium]